MTLEKKSGQSYRKGNSTPLSLIPEKKNIHGIAFKAMSLL